MARRRASRPLTPFSSMATATLSRAFKNGIIVCLENEADPLATEASSVHVRDAIRENVVVVQPDSSPAGLDDQATVAKTPGASTGRRC